MQFNDENPTQVVLRQYVSAGVWADERARASYMNGMRLQLTAMVSERGGLKTVGEPEITATHEVPTEDLQRMPEGWLLAVGRWNVAPSATRG
jgi:hypothetical protein